MKSTKQTFDNLRETTIAKHCVHQGKSFSFWSDEVVFPNGKTGKRDYVNYPHAVAILPLIDNKILFIRQYRYAPAQVLLEIPAGKMDPHETPTDTVRRELREETGYDATEITPLLSYYPCPGYSTEKIHTYVARGLVPSPLSMDEDEFIVTELLSFEEAMKAISDGTIQDGKTILALFAYQNMFTQE